MNECATDFRSWLLRSLANLEACEVCIVEGGISTHHITVVRCVIAHRTSFRFLSVQLEIQA